MSKIISQQSKNNQNKIIKVNGSNNLPKVQRKIINQANEEIISTKKNKKIYISETISNNNSISPRIINTKNYISNERSPSPKYYKLVTHTPNINYKVIDATEINDDILEKTLNDEKSINNNVNMNNNIIYNNTEYNNNEFYLSKTKYEYERKIKNNKNNNNNLIEYNSCSYDMKRTKRTIKYNYNSPDKNSKILVKSIVCSPLKVCYTKIDNPLLQKTYKEYKEEIEETEIVIKNKMRKIWENENEYVAECNFSLFGEKNNDNNYIIEEYEEKIKELNSTIFSLTKTKNSLEQQIEELQYNLNNKEFNNMELQSFYINFINETVNNNIFDDKFKSWNKIVKKQNTNFINLYGTKKIKKPLKIQKLEKVTILRSKKPLNVIDYGTYLQILSTNDKQTHKSNISLEYGDDLFIPGKEKVKNEIVKLKGFNIFKKYKPKKKNIIEHLNKIQINPKQNLKLKNKPKFNNIIVNTNNIFIPPKKKELFTWDTFYGQELYILPKKKKKIFEIEFLDDLEILKAPKPENEIEFIEPIGIMPEPKAPFEINFTEEFYIPESIKKLRSPPKPTNKIVYKDKIKLLGKKLGKNIVQKVSLVEIYSYTKPKIIDYEENDYLFIPGQIKPENKIQLGDYLEILSEQIKHIEYAFESCDIINLFALDRPINEKQQIESFDIFRKEKPGNVIDQNYFISIESSPKQYNLEIYFGDELIIEKELRPNNKIQRLKGFNILKKIKPKPLNKIQINDEIEILPEPKQPINLIYENIDLFTIDNIEKPKNKIQRISEVKILKKDKINKKYINKIFKPNSLSIFGKKKPRNYIQKANDINIYGKIKQNEFEIEFKDEMIIEEIERPINKIQKTHDISIYKKPKIKKINIKQRAFEYQILKKISTKPKNKIQKRDNISIYSKPIQKENTLEIYFGDELIIEKELRPNNKMQRLKGFNILKKIKPKPLNKIQINDEIEILPEPKQPINLIYENIDLFTIDNIEKPINKPQRINGFEIIKKIAKPINRYMKIEQFTIPVSKKENKLKNIKYKNIIEDTANFQIISVSIRELYQQRLQGFTIYKNEKEPNEIEKNYNFVIQKEYDALLARPIWDDLYIQKEYFSILPNYNLSKFKNEVQDDFIIEANSLNSRFKESYNNDSFTNSKDLSVDICRYCGGKKRVLENNISKEINILKSNRENNFYKNINNTNINSIKSKGIKTLLVITQNEIDYINNIEICSENKNDKILFSDDECAKERKIRINNINYDNKSYDINRKAKIIEYNKNYKNNNNTYFNNKLNISNSDVCNYSQASEENNLKNANYRINNKFISNNILKKRYYNYNRYDNNNNINNYNQTGLSRYTYYRNISNGQGTNRIYQNKSVITNRNRKRKLYRFEEGKDIKVIYQ